MRPLARDLAGTEGQGAVQLYAAPAPPWHWGTLFQVIHLRFIPNPVTLEHCQLRGGLLFQLRTVVRAGRTLVASGFWAQFPRL